MTRIPLLVLTGFLGSGKTTLLNRFVQTAGFRDTAIVINEAGLVGLDHLLIEQGEDGVVMLDGGCLCCRLDGGGLAAALAALLRRRRPDGTLPFARVVVETSGLADPAPILQNLIADVIFNRHFTIAGVVTTVDALAFAASVAHHPEAGMQVALGDRLVLTKTDLIDPQSLQQLQKHLRDVNPRAAQIVVQSSVVTPDMIWTETFDLARLQDIDSAPRGDAASVVTAARRFAGTLDASALDDWLETTLALFGPALLRLKGLVHVDGQDDPIVLHAVQGVLHGFSATAQIADDGDNRIVLIARDVEATALDDALEDLCQRARPTAMPVNIVGASVADSRRWA